MKFAISLCLMLAGACPALAQSSGGPYSISATSLDPAGGRATGGVYRQDTAMGATGSQAASSAAYQAASGYPSMVRDVTSLAVLPGTLAESASTTLTLRQILDDGTQSPVSSLGAVWNVLSGPVTISPSGVASTQIVPATANASLQVTLGTVTSSATLTIQDTIPDNFGTYGSDGVSDTWQMQHFGANNPQAAPDVDADGDGQTNLFEFVAGLSPTSGNSRFSVTIEEAPGQPGKTRMVFHPANAGRLFTLYRNTSLSPNGWEPVPGATTSGNNNTSMLMDPAPPEQRVFYRVQINLQ